MINAIVISFLFLDFTDIIELHKIDSNGDPVLNGQVVTVTGRVTATGEFGPKGPFFIQDETGGVAVYDYYGAYIPNLSIGDSVVVTGKVKPYNGLTELQYLEEVQIISHGEDISTDTIKPDEMGLIENNYEVNEGRFVILLNVYFLDTGTFEKNTAYTIKDIEGREGVVYIKSDELVGMTIPQETVFVKGVVNQYDREAPYFEGYEIFPRFKEDIDTMPSGGVEETQYKAKIRVNYMDGFIKIEGVESKHRVEIYNILGKPIFSGYVKNDGILEFHEKGIFFLKYRNRVIKFTVW